jgi:hypothetical protein
VDLASAPAAATGTGPAAWALQVVRRGQLTGLPLTPRMLVLVLLRHVQSSCRQQLEERLDAAAAELRQVRHVTVGPVTRGQLPAYWHIPPCGALGRNTLGRCNWMQHQPYVNWPISTLLSVRMKGFTDAQMPCNTHRHGGSCGSSRRSACAVQRPAVPTAADQGRGLLLQQRQLQATAAAAS